MDGPGSQLVDDEIELGDGAISFMVSFKVPSTVRLVIGRQLNHPESPPGRVCGAASAQCTREENFSIGAPKSPELRGYMHARPLSSGGTGGVSFPF